MNNPVIIDLDQISRGLNLPEDSVSRTVELLDEGNTVPFITRYRKDQTGGLDEEQIRLVHDRVSKARLLVERKDKIVRLIEAKQQLTPELSQQIRTASTIKRLEDLYLPFKPKKQTRATVARQKGLEPLAEEVLSASAEHSLTEAAAKYISADNDLADEAAVLNGVGHIIAEALSERADLRGKLRKLIRQHGRLTSTHIVPSPSSVQESPTPVAATPVAATPETAASEAPVSEAPVSEAHATDVAEDAQAPAVSASNEATPDQLRTSAADPSAAASPTAASPTADPSTADSTSSDSTSSDSTSSDSTTGQLPAAETSLEAAAVLPADDAATEIASGDEPASGTTTSDDSASAAALETTASEPAASETAASETAASETAASETAASETAASETAASEPAASETAASETAASETAASETAASETAASETAASETAASETAASETAASETTGPGPALEAPSTSSANPVAATTTTVNKLSPRQQKKKKKQEKLQAAFTDYFQFAESIPRVPPHRVLAINRGEKAKILRVRIEVDSEKLFEVACHMVLAEPHPHAEFLKECLRDALQRMVIPSLEREVRRELTEKAEQHAVQVFVRNLRHLLLQPPVHGRRTLAMDPGYRSGCKLVALDEFGGVLGHAVIHVIGNEQRKARERQKLVKMIRKYGSTLIAIGNGTACRETEQIAADALRDLGSDEAEFVIVNEAGASVYSTSQIGREELPDFDATLRSSVSIGRRLLDPLSELVKINPANIGVGMYQHDVKAKHLRESLESVVESCVNYVGVDVNTASPSLLAYVSGLNQLTARRLYEYRQEHGPFKNRNQFRDVPGFGDAAFVQAAGFLKIVGGDNPLDATWIHPESYDTAQRVLESIGSSVDDLASRKPAVDAASSAAVATAESATVESATVATVESAIADAVVVGSEAVDGIASGEAAAGSQAEVVAEDADAAGENVADTIVLPLSPTPPLPHGSQEEPSLAEPSTPEPPTYEPSITDTVVLPLSPSPPTPHSGGDEEVSVGEPPSESSITDTVVLPLSPSPPTPHSGGDEELSAGEPPTEPSSTDTVVLPLSPSPPLPHSPNQEDSPTATESIDVEPTATEPIDVDRTAAAAATTSAGRPHGLQEVVANVVSDKAIRTRALPVIPSAVREKLAAIEKADLAQQLSIGELLLGDILASLSRPGRDPREDFPGPVFRKGIMKMEDLESGMELSGTVLNVVDFGAFVDIGLSDSALVHISRLADRYVSDPHEVTSVGDVIKVWVLSVDKDRRRVSLTAIEPGTEKPDEQRRGRRKKTEQRRPVKHKAAAKKRPAKPKTERKQPKRPKFIPPITQEMEDGNEPMRTFSDLMQFYTKKRDD